MQPVWVAYVERYGDGRVRSAMLHLLGWMQQCGFRGEVKPMALRSDLPWCQDLEFWTTERPLSELLRVQRTHFYQAREHLVFQPTVSHEEQLEIVRYVFGHLGAPRPL